MATRSRLCLFLSVFFLLGLSSAYAQIAGYYIDREGDAPRFIQRLAWSGGSYAMRYEIEIEALDIDMIDIDMIEGETYRTVHQEFTTALFVEVSLRPGYYRFHVTSYDASDRPYVTSEWKYIEVLPAMQPELLAVASYIFEESGTDDDNIYLISLEGYNLDPNAEVFIRYDDGTQIEVAALVSDGNFSFFINGGLVGSDDYEVIIRNPGGLEASISGAPLQKPEIVELEPSRRERPIAREPESEKLKPFLVSAGLAYMPMFPIYGDYIGYNGALKSVVARINFLIYFPIGVYIGPEFSAMFFIEDNETNYSSQTFFPFSMIGGNLLVRKWFFDEKAALTFRAGADYDESMTISYGLSQEFKPVNINIRVDLSFLLRIGKKLIIEVGVDFSHMITKIDENYFLKTEITGGFLRPWFGLGWQF